MTKKKPIKVVAVDFDGTIVTHEYPDIGLPVPGALETLLALQEAGVKIILWTMRSGDKLQAAVDYLENRGIDIWVNENPEQGTWTDSPKAYAQLYIDDAAYGCPLTQPEIRIGARTEDHGRPCVDWPKIVAYLRANKVCNSPGMEEVLREAGALPSRRTDV